MVFVEGFFRLAHGLVTTPGLWNHHHHGVRERATGKDHQLQGVVKNGRVRAVHIDDWLDLVDVVTKEIGGKPGLTRIHPADVATQRIDLTVMGDVAIRMRALPVREGVCRETRMNQS